MAERFDTVVVGGGPAGMAAAIAAARAGRTAAIVDRMPRLGKKLLTTGGGRCNLSNERLVPELYESTAPGLVSAVLSRFGSAEIAGFFRELGLRTASEEGRVYPATQQAASVLKVLELELRRRGVAVRGGFPAVSVEPGADRLAVKSLDGRRIEARAVVLACGGRSYPALGSDGSGYNLARGLGHKIVEPVPSCVPLLARDRMTHLLQGQKMRVRATARIGARAVAQAEGDLLFTAYGLSGTAILDVSTPLSIALNREDAAGASVGVDFLPDLSRDDLAAELARRLETGWEEADLVSGLLPEKLGRVVAEWVVAGANKPAAAAELAAVLHDRRIPVYGTRGWNEAEFTSGGVDAREVEPVRLESRRAPGVHLAGEMLDVQGPRGGYNLAWAWASGTLAGRAAAEGRASR